MNKEDVDERGRIEKEKKSRTIRTHALSHEVYSEELSPVCCAAWPKLTHNFGIRARERFPFCAIVESRWVDFMRMEGVTEGVNAKDII